MKKMHAIFYDRHKKARVNGIRTMVASMERQSSKRQTGCVRLIANDCLRKRGDSEARFAQARLTQTLNTWMRTGRSWGMLQLYAAARILQESKRAYDSEVHIVPRGLCA